MLRSAVYVTLCLTGTLTSCVTTDAPATTDDDSALTAVAPDGASRDPIALTEGGLVRGTATATTHVFRGIPYAAPPVGDRRWQPPAHAARWNGIRDASQFASHCPQIASPFGQVSTSEDCLYLNVYTPTGRDPHDRFGLHPVMVWIHGGALITGEGDNYDPTRLVTQGDVIVVTINYRLGALGFTSHPALSAGSPDHASGNYGLMDQQAALRWVQRNILLFGGDPEQVTIFGESAGGLSVHSQLVAPSSHGLFQRAIVESGAYQLTVPDLATAEAAGEAFATAAGCSDQTAACLRALPVAQVLASQNNGTDGASPVIDHVFLDQAIGDALTSGEFNRVPVLEGSNHDEWRLFVGENELLTGPLPAAAYVPAIGATLGLPLAEAAQVAALYPLSNFASTELALSALGTDAIFACNAHFAEGQLARFVPTFAYEFKDENAPERFLPPVSFPYAAAHASELQYLFDLPVEVPAPALTAAQLQLAHAMVAGWTTFARTGDPGAGWPRFRNEAERALVPPAPQVETGFAADHLCAFWDAIVPH